MGNGPKRSGRRAAANPSDEAATATRLPERIDVHIHAYLDVAERFGVDPPALPEDADGEDYRRWLAKRGIAAAEAMESAAGLELPSVQFRAVADMEGPRVGGPGMWPPELASMVVDGLTTVADVLAVAAGVGTLVAWLRKKGAQDIHVDRDGALLLAFDFVAQASGSTDLAYRSAVPIRPTAADWEGGISGHLVEIETNGTVWRVPVMLDGTVLTPDYVDLNDVGDSFATEKAEDTNVRDTPRSRRKKHPKREKRRPGESRKRRAHG